MHVGVCACRYVCGEGGGRVSVGVDLGIGVCVWGGGVGGGGSRVR